MNEGGYKTLSTAINNILFFVKSNYECDYNSCGSLAKEYLSDMIIWYIYLYILINYILVIVMN